MRRRHALRNVFLVTCLSVAGAASASPPAGGGLAGEPRNLHGYGAVAVRRGSALYVLDGDAPPARGLRRVESGAIVRAMRWSHDGAWLAYATDRGLRLVARKTLRVSRVPLTYAVGDRFEWSPSFDALAVVHETPGAPCARGCPPVAQRGTTFERGRVDVVFPGAAIERLTGAAAAVGVRWSPSGRDATSLVAQGMLPFARWSAEREALFSLRTRSDAVAPPLVVRVASNPGGQVAFASLAPRGDGMLYWSGDELSADAAGDGQELRYQAAPGAATFPLVEMLPRAGWLSFSPRGDRVVVVRGRGREAWHAKSLAVCRIESGVACRSLPQPAGTIALDPRWSPADERIAFVRARDLGPNGAYGPDLRTFTRKYVDVRALWVIDADGSHARALARFGNGIAWPAWSRDGRRLLVYRDGALWLGAPGGAVARVVTGLPTPDEMGDVLFAGHGAVGEDESPFAWTGG